MIQCSSHSLLATKKCVLRFLYFIKESIHGKIYRTFIYELTHKKKKKENSDEEQEKIYNNVS